MWNKNFCFCLKTKMQTHAQTQMYLNRGGEREMQGRNVSCERYVYFMYNLKKNCSWLGLKTIYLDVNK